jgi:hypothetical protein
LVPESIQINGQVSYFGKLTQDDLFVPNILVKMVILIQNPKGCVGANLSHHTTDLPEHIANQQLLP